MNTKRNQTFNYLYFLAIIMVIDDHCNTSINILANIFPYNSFYMPLFVFCSGYFFKEMPLKQFLVHKTKKLFLPYLLWNITALFVASLIDFIIGTKWAVKLSISDFFRMLFHSSPTSINGASWFVIMLFWVSICYGLIRKIVTSSKMKDFCLTILFTILGIISVSICINNNLIYTNIIDQMIISACKILFYIQFYNLGYIFKKYIEKNIASSNKFIIASICIITNIILLVLYGDKINFYSTSNMEGFNSCILPLITSLTGITFYYTTMSFLSQKIGSLKIIDFVSQNTFIILETHLLFINIPNLYIYLLAKNGVSKYADFPIQEFLDNAWVRYNSNACLIGFLCGIIGSFISIGIFILLKKKVFQIIRRG